MQGVTMWRIESAAARLRQQQESDLLTLSHDGSNQIPAELSITPGHSFLPTARSGSLTRRTTMRRAGSSGSSGPGDRGSAAVLVPVEYSAHGTRRSADVAAALAMTEAAYESLACLEGAGSGSLDALSAFHPDVAGGYELSRYPDVMLQVRAVHTPVVRHQHLLHVSHHGKLCAYLCCFVLQRVLHLAAHQLLVQCTAPATV
jgi:hypothetical protein